MLKRSPTQNPIIKAENGASRDPRQVLESAIGIEAVEAIAGSMRSTMMGAANLLRFARVASGRTLEAAGTKIDSMLTPTPLDRQAPKTLQVIAVAKGLVRTTYKKIVEASREIEIAEPIDYSKLPNLLDDHDEDVRFKSDIVHRLGSRLDTKLNLRAEIEQLTRIAFEIGIEPQKLTEFLESDQIIEIMIDVAINYPHSRRRTSSLLARIGSTSESIESKLMAAADKFTKKEMPLEIETEILAKLQFFRDDFKPGDQKYTVVRLVEELSNDYPEYDIPGFMRKNKQYLIDAIKGAPTRELPAGKNHIRNLIIQGYRKCAAESEENAVKFIRLNLPNLMQARMEDDTPLLTINANEIQKFFRTLMSTMRKAGIGPVKFRRAIQDMFAEIHANIGVDVEQVLIKSGNTTRVEKVYSDEQLGSLIREMVSEATKHSGSYIDIVDLLSDPENVPPSLEEDHKLFFKEDGSFSDAYYHRVRSLFSLVLESEGGKAKQEDFEQVRAKLSTAFEAINHYLKDYDEALGLPPIAQIREVVEENEYGNLVRLACTTEDKTVRAAACAKIQLAMLHYSIAYSPRFVFQDHDAKQIKLRLERLRNGLVIKHNAEGKVPVRKIRFIENIGGLVYVMDDDPDEPETEIPVVSDLNEMYLIPAKLGGTECFVMPVGVDEGGSPIDYAEVGEIDLKTFEYIGKKSSESGKTKILRREKYRAKDITDLIRMTFVVKSFVEFFKLKDHIEREYLSFGQILKFENRYDQTFTREYATDQYDNPSKDGSYRCLRYVAYMPIPSSDGTHSYFAPIEMRIMLIEDAAMEKSNHHKASHQRYEIDRRQEIAELLRPHAIWPELWKEEAPNPKDPFKRKRMVLKSSEDFKFAA